MKSQQQPDFNMKESKLNTIKWKNLSMRYLKQVKTLENAIMQQQRDLDRRNKVADKKHGGKAYGKHDDFDEMTELIEPEYTGEEGEMQPALKQRHKNGARGETFEMFMQRRSQRIGE